MSLARYTWKTWGVSLTTLEHNTSVEQLLEYEEMMHVAGDYEYASYEDNKPKK